MKGTFVQIASIRLMRLRCRRTALCDQPRASRVGEPGVEQSSSRHTQRPEAMKPTKYSSCHTAQGEANRQEVCQA